MAKKKTQTPAPPRPVQAPKRRYEPTSGGVSQRARLIAAAAAVAVLAMLAIALAATRGGGGSSQAAKQLASAGCTVKTYPSLGQKHVSSLTAKVKYNSFPPTSGPHYSQPAPWNFYDGPVDSQVRIVHNLEHGGIVVQWGSKVSSATVAELRAFWQESPNGMLMAPLPKLGDKIALAAWTHLAICTRADQSALKAFRDAYRGKGPEKFPVSQLTPGT